MISCIIIDSMKTIKLNYKKTFKEIFYGDYFEINEYPNRKTIIFIRGIEKKKVWQAVLNLEVDQIIVGFGFGEEKEVARKEALDRLKMIFEMKIH